MTDLLPSADQPLHAVLPALKEALESCAGSYEMMKEVVAAVGDAERGRSTSMAGLLANVQSRQSSKLAEKTLQVRGSAVTCKPAMWAGRQ